MGFIMDGLDREDYDRNYSDWELLTRILDYFRPHYRRMIVVAIMIVLGSSLETIVPIVVSRGIDVLAENPTTMLLVGLATGVVLLNSTAWMFNFFRQSYSARAVGDVVLKLREDAFTAVTERDLSFYDEHPSGKIVSRVTSDTQDFAEVVRLTMNLLSQLLLVVIITGVLLYINLQLALLTILMAPVVVAVALGFRRIARVTTQHSRRALARVNAAIQESLSGIVIAKSFRQEQAVYNDFDAINKQAYGVNLRQGFVMSSIFPILGFVAGIGTAVIVYFGGLTAHQGTISAGDWYLFIQALALYWFPLTSIASFWSQFQAGLAAAERVFALMDADPKVVQEAAEPAPKLQGRIEFQNVVFRYKPDETVLPRFSLTIEAGESVALVGHTGAGKSSIARLIARFYEFQGGRILVDGRDLRRLDLSQYRPHLGIVPQSPFLFSGTVGDNVRYSRPDASDAEVEVIARKIGDGDWLEDLPEGLQTDVGERGSRLSMGQRQLVALARVLLQDPTIFILDEATASVDPFTEAQIQEAVDLILRDRTSIVIAHRLSTVKSADRIIVLANGRIIEEGTHHSLLAAGGHYAELYNTYFRFQSLGYIEEVGELRRGRVPASVAMAAS